MAGLLGFLAAGAVSGAGAGIVAEAQAKRAEAIASLENMRLESREAKDRAFRSSENSLDRNARVSDSAADRAFREKEGALDRASVEKRAVERVDTTPADVKTAQWYKDASEEDRAAYDKITAKTTNTDIKPGDRARLIIDQFKTSKEASLLNGDERTDDELLAAATSTVDTTLGKTEARPTAETGASATGSETPAAVVRPDGASDDELIAEGVAAVKRGASKEAVASRLRQLGVDPSKAGL